jgi:hypothetical protein
MRRIAKGAEIGIVRRDDEYPATASEQAMNFLHHPDDVRHMLDDMDSANFAERMIAQRIGKPVEVGDDVGARVGTSIEANSARVFVNAAANIENRKCRWNWICWSTALRHSSV